MADNLNITSGSGLTIKTDDVGGIHYQQIKLADSDLNSTAAIGVSANPLYVRLGTLSEVSGGITLVSASAVTVTGSVTLASASAVTVSGSVTIASASAVTVTGGVTILSSIPLSVSTTTTNPLHVEVLNTYTTTEVSGGVTLLSSIPLDVSVLNSYLVTEVSGGISILSQPAISVTTTGGVTILSSVPLSVSVLNTYTTTEVSGGITLLSASAVTVSGTVTSVATVSGSVTLASASAVTITGGVSLLSPNLLAVTSLPHGDTATWAYVSLDSNARVAVWNPGAAKRFNITDIVVNNNSASTITITQDSASTITLWKLMLADNGGFVSNLRIPKSATVTKHILYATTSVIGTNAWVSVSGYLSD